MLEVIPAIDIQNGRCVRLLQGDPSKETIYNDSPVSQGLIWEGEGVNLIHVVDLDGAFAGRPKNLEIVKDLSNSLIKARVEIGGGIRDLETIRLYLEHGMVERVILGSAAYKDKRFTKEALKEFGADRIIVGIDCIEGYVAISGWKERTDTKLVEFIKELNDYGVKELIITDISRDGMLSGIDAGFYIKTLKLTKSNIIASGGVSSLKDIKELEKVHKETKRLSGVIVGKALYEGNFSIKEAKDACK